MEIVNAIVLKSVEYKDNDRLVTLFSLERGKITVNAKGVKKAGAKLKFCAQPFCFAEYVLAEKNDRYTITQATLHDSFYKLSEDISSYYCGAVMLEFINSFMPDDLPSVEIFHLLIKAIECLCYKNSDKKTILIKFLLEGLALNGFAIQTECCSDCGGNIDEKVYMSPQNGAIICEKCKRDGYIEFNINTYKFLCCINDASLDNLTEIDDVNDISKKKALKLLSYYISLNTDIKINTLKTVIDTDF